MIERSEFIKRGEAILDFLDVYNTIRHEHLEKFFPDSNKIVDYLVKNFRLFKSTDGTFIDTDENPRSDKCLVAALGVLADVFEKVKSHALATAPAQISFITHSGDYYEIIYVAYGMEAMVVASFEAQHTAEDVTKRIVIVENQSQMERLSLPGITRFALIQPDGSLSYHKGS